MKETVRTSRTAGYLEKCFRILNAYYFNGEIEEPIITLQSTPKAYGHVTVNKSWTRGHDGSKIGRHNFAMAAYMIFRYVKELLEGEIEF